MDNVKKKEVKTIPDEHSGEAPCVTRRKLLMLGGLATVTTLLPPGLFNRGAANGPGSLAHAATGEGRVSSPVAARTARYPRKKVGQLSALKVDEPVQISYPGEHEGHLALLIKLGVPALGGIGPQQDVVAFNAFCTHQGGPLEDRYDAEYKTMGPCEFHLSTFDLARHGLITSASATQNLPQVVLELEGDDIYAVGMLGLIYGFPDNLLPV